MNLRENGRIMPVQRVTTFQTVNVGSAFRSLRIVAGFILLLLGVLIFLKPELVAYMLAALLVMAGVSLIVSSLRPMPSGGMGASRVRVYPDDAGIVDQP
jgi:uncharacterized membrane protein HdeD (DUF308 family)